MSALNTIEKHDRIQELTICEYCKHIFQRPVLLPCGESICRKHLRELVPINEESRSHVMCYFCCELHDYDEEHDFPPNKLVEKLVDLEVVNSQTHYELCKRACDKLRSKIIEFEEIKSNPMSYLAKFFDQLKTEVEDKKHESDVAAELLKEKIFDSLYMFYNECQMAAETHKLHDMGSTEIAESSTLLNHNYRHLNQLLLNDYFELETIKSKVEEKCVEIDRLLNGIKDIVFLGMDIRFEPSRQHNNFGELKMVC